MFSCDNGISSKRDRIDIRAEICTNIMRLSHICFKLTNAGVPGGVSQ